MMYAIYVQQTRAIHYAEAIVEGLKPVETRTRNMLKRLVGKRVAVIRTWDRGQRPAEIIGYVTIDRAEYHTAAELDAMRNDTLIPPGSKYDCTGAGKWCYYLSNPESRAPIALDKLPLIRRNRSYAIYAE